MDKYWDTTIDELMAIFREALIAMFPSLRKAQIPFGLCVGGDAWDEISETLFEQIVVESIRYSFDIEEMDLLKIPTYESYYDSYKEYSFIKVFPINDNGDKAIFAFHSFVEPDDSSDEITAIRCFKINEKGDILDQDHIIFPYDQVRFALYFKGRETRELSEISVLL